MIQPALAPLVYDEALNDWFEADCQQRRNEKDPICGQPAVVHRPNKLIVRHVCAGHATPEELAREAARPGGPGAASSLPTERS